MAARLSGTFSLRRLSVTTSTLALVAIACAPSAAYAQQADCDPGGGPYAGGFPQFNGDCKVEADTADTFSGTVAAVFRNGAVLNANAPDAVSGGLVQLQTGNAVVNANVARAISGGTLVINGTVNARATGAIDGAWLRIGGDGVINIGAVNATTKNTAVEFGSQVVTVGGLLKLDGHDTVLGRLSYYIPSGQIVNGGATDATFTLDSSVLGDSAFGGTLADGSGGGTLALVKRGAGTLELSGANSHSGGTLIDSGVLKLTGFGGLGADSGALTIAGGGTLAFDSVGLTVGSLSGAGTIIRSNYNPGTLTVHQDTDTAFSGSISSYFDEIDGVTTTLGLTKSGTGTLTLSGNNRYNGETNVTGGTLLVDGTLGHVFWGSLEQGTTQVTVASGGRFGGAGSIEGHVYVAPGGTLLGKAGQTLTMRGLTMDSGSTLDVALGAPSTAALFDITGSLALRGTLNVSDAGGFGLGLYRLFDYDGQLTSRSLTIGTTPTGYAASDLTVQTSVYHQVNLYVGEVPSSGFWDGANTAADNVVNGGSGTWSADGTNWTTVSGGANGAYDPAAMLIFQNAPGTVTVDAGGGALDVTGGMQFFVDGYRVEGDELRLGGVATPIRVGDGTAAGAGMTATIASGLGSGGIEKTDLGTLVLTGVSNIGRKEILVNGGTLAIRGGGRMTDYATYIAASATASGTVTVDGAGSALINRDYFQVGQYGNGTLAVTGGGLVSTSFGGVAQEAGSTGTATIDGAGSAWVNTDTLIIGEHGNGTLAVTGGGLVSTQFGRVAQKADSTGTATIDGAGSTWVNTDDLLIGEYGTGALTITRGGSLSNTAGAIGFNAGSSGTVTVDGAGSTWTNSSDLFVGYDGDGALTITNGGSVSNAAGTIGQYGGSGTVIVDGVGSKWTNGDTLFVGEQGTGALTIRGGGVVSAPEVHVSPDGYVTNTRGVITIGGRREGVAQAPGTLDTPIIYLHPTGMLDFDHDAADYVFAPEIRADGVVRQLSGTTILTADSSDFFGDVSITGGELRVDGSLAGAGVLVSGGTLSGSGSVGGVLVDTGGTLAGTAGATLAIDNMRLTSEANIDVALGAPSTAALFDVATDMMLDGTLNVRDAGGFGAGLYRLFDYGGTLYDNGLSVGAAPTGYTASDLTVQTSVAHQINLLVGTPLPPASYSFWDGAGSAADNSVNGGGGTWSAGGTNWTNVGGGANGVYDPAAMLIFQGAPGTVTVDAGGGALDVTGGMQFFVDGYRVEGGPLKLTAAATPIRVGDGTAAGAAMTATIASVLTGGGGIAKTDLGTLTLTGANSYTGGTSVEAGTLVAGASGALGSGSVNVTGANLDVLSGVVLHNKVVLADNGPVGSTLVNRGLLSIAGGTLVSVTGSASSVINHGTIRSAVNTNGDPAATGVSVSGGATLTNHGFITGLGLFPNAGVGVSLSGGSTLVNNGGHIQATERGVTLNGVGNSVINAAGARITGDRKAISDGGGGVTLVNAGMITGDVELIGAAANAVTLVSGGRIEGQLEMGSNTASTLTLDGTGSQLYSAAVTGFTGFDGTLTKTGTGSWTIDKALTPGSVSVEAGTLAVTNTLTSPTVSVSGTGVLAGSGGIAGAVSIGNGGTLRGTSGATLTMGSLTLAADAQIDVSLGAPSASALFDVTGNLTLDGTLNVTNAGSFGSGLYRLFDAGSITDNGLQIGTVPAGYGSSNLSFQSTSRQVNLLVGSTYAFWDGADTAANTIVDGGTGVWSAGGTNWTVANGATNGGYDPAALLLFAGSAGTVTVDAGGGALDVGGGMQFFATGYRVEGGALNLTQPSVTLRVGDGTRPGAGISATIASVLTGGGGVAKTDLGTLTLTGANSYAGGTTVNAGTLIAGASGALGSGSVNVTGANLDVLSGVVLHNKVVLADDGPVGSTLVNRGLLSIAGGTLVSVTGSASSVTNHGTIRSAAATNGDPAATGVSLSGGATLTNHGFITGLGLFPNAGVGVSLSGGSTLVNNGGHIEATERGVTLNGVGNSVINAAGARITGDRKAISNSGGGVTLVNAGLITGDVELIGAAANAVTLVSGGRIEGQLEMGSNTASTLTLDGTGSQLYSAAVTGFTGFDGTLTKTGTGSWTIDKALTPGSVSVEAGTLAVTSTLTSPTVSVSGTGVLAGSGNIAGAVSIGNGGTLRGASGATLTMGSLTLGSDSNVDVALGAPSASALFDVTGNLTLDGTLNVTDAGAFGNGVYRLFSYGGTLTDNGLSVGTIAGGTSGTVQTATANQVNLLVGSVNIFWNGSTPAAGTIVGGSGIWKRRGDNWTDATGTVTLPWQGGFAVFQGQPGTVTVDDSDGPIDVTGMQFIGQGWLLDGDSITLAGPDNSTVIRVGDGTAQGASDFATIGSGLKGGGTLVKEDFGKLILTGDSSSFTGTTTIGKGTLSVNGVLGGALDVLAGGRLQGTGTVGDLIVRGTIAPGNSIGTLNVAGNIGFAAGSTYEVEANAAGQSDRIVATGHAAISGGTVTVLAEAGNYQPRTDYTILTAAGGVTGAFADVTSNLAFLDPSLRYDASHVYLRLTRNDISFAGIGLTPNQVATGEATEALGWGRPVFEAVVNRSASQARDAFDQLSGEIHPSARMAMIEDSRLVRTAVWDRQRASAGEDGRGLWGQALGNWGHSSGNGNAARLDRSTGGLLMGIDAAAGEDVRVGAVWGYSRTRIDVDQRGSSGRIDSYHLGAYAGGQWGGFALRTGLAYSWSDLHTTRTIAFPGFADRTQASYHGGTFQAFGEAAYGVDLGKTSVEPFAGLAYVRARTNAVTETGGGAGLSGAKAATAVTVSTLGLRAATRFDVGSANATLRVGAGWRHAFGDAAPITAMRYQAGGNAFAIAGLPVARDAVAFDAGLDVAVSDRTSIGISYNGQIGKGLSDQAAKASIRFRF